MVTDKRLTGHPISLALAAAGIGVRAPQSPGVTASTIVIGQSAPLTGANAELGNDIRNGALAYFKKINDAGGVNGRKIELATLDDANQVPRAEANTKKLLEEARGFALFGYASATLSRPALPLVEQHKAAFLSPFTGAEPMRVFNRHVYNMRASYADELEKIVEHYTTFGINRFSVVHYDDIVGKENLTAVERAEEAQPGDGVGGGLEGPRQARHRGRPPGRDEGQSRSRDLHHALQGDFGFHQEREQGRFRTADGKQLLPGSEPARQGAGQGGTGPARRPSGAAAHQALGAGGEGIPGSDREAARQEGLFIHFSRGVHRR